MAHREEQGSLWRTERSGAACGVGRTERSGSPPSYRSGRPGQRRQCSRPAGRARTAPPAAGSHCGRPPLGRSPAAGGSRWGGAWLIYGSGLWGFRWGPGGKGAKSVSTKRIYRYQYHSSCSTAVPAPCAACTPLLSLLSASRASGAGPSTHLELPRPPGGVCCAVTVLAPAGPCTLALHSGKRLHVVAAENLPLLTSAGAQAQHACVRAGICPEGWPQAGTARPDLVFAHPHCRRRSSPPNTWAASAQAEHLLAHFQT